MAVPAFPQELSDSTWKTKTEKVKAKVPVQGISQQLQKLLTQFNAIDKKAFENLEKAIKEKKDVQPNYQVLGDKVFPKIDEYESLADTYKEMCKSIVETLIKASDTKEAGQWLSKSAEAAAKHAKAISDLGDKLLKDAENIPPEKMVDIKRELTAWDVTKLLHTLGIQLKYLQLPPKKEAAILIEGKVGEVMVKNSTLFQMFYDAGWQEAKACGEVLKKELESLDAKLGAGTVQPGLAQKAIDLVYKKFDTSVKQRAVAAVTKTWEEYCKEHVEYRDYKIKAALRVTAQTAGVAAGIATAVTTGWTGAGTILGIIGIIKGVMTLGREITILWIEAETLGIKVKKDIQDLIDKYLAEEKNLNAVGEVAKAAVTRLTGYQVQSIEQVKKDHGTYDNKLKGCKDKAVIGGGSLKSLLDETTATEKKITRMKDALKTVKRVQPKIDKLQVVLKKTEGEVHQLVTMISGRMEAYNKGLKTSEEFKVAIEGLEGNVAEWGNVVKKYVVPLLDFYNVSDLKSAIETTASLSIELASTAGEVEEEIEGAVSAKEIVGNVSSMIEVLKGK